MLLKNMKAVTQDVAYKPCEKSDNKTKEPNSKTELNYSLALSRQPVFSSSGYCNKFSGLTFPYLHFKAILLKNYFALQYSWT